MPRSTARGFSSALREPDLAGVRANVEEVRSPSSPPRPTNKASKAVWVAYAEALGEDSSGSKAVLIERVG